MKRISMIGYVPANEKETNTLKECGLTTTNIRDKLKAGITKTKKEAIELFGEDDPKKVRVTVTIDVEKM
jgi:arginase family enzyme